MSNMRNRDLEIYKKISDLVPDKYFANKFSVNRNKLRNRLLEEGKITLDQTVCHHICPVWRYFDHERYARCDERDVEFVTPQQHAKIHEDWAKREKEYFFLTNMFTDAAKKYGVYLLDYWKIPNTVYED